MSKEPSQNIQQEPAAENPLVETNYPRFYGSFPTLFGAPLAETEERLADADVAFVGVPWRAPTAPSTFLISGANSNYEGTQLTPSYFRLNSLPFAGGYLPELDLEVFSDLTVVDRGDVDVPSDMGQILSNVEAEISVMLDAGCIPIVLGGNAGPSTYPVVRTIAKRAGGPTAILNFDAHGDNVPGNWREEDPRNPSWAETWVYQTLASSEVDAGGYYHVGLRGAINDRDTLRRFEDLGARRENVFTAREVRRARREGFDGWAEELARRITDGAAKVWIAVDPDVLTSGSNPDFTSEPLGPTADELIELVYRVARAAGREKFGGISFMATPSTAQTLHATLIYVVLYALAGISTSGSEEAF